MALPTPHPLNQETLDAYMADSGSASSVYLVAPFAGYISKFVSVLQGTTVGTANNTFTVSINGTSLATDTWQQATSGSAVGDRVTVYPTSFSAATVAEGDLITVTSDGAGSNTTPTMIYVQFTAH